MTGGPILDLAGALPLWRDVAIAGLAAIIIACLWIYAALIGGDR